MRIFKTRSFIKFTRDLSLSGNTKFIDVFPDFCRDFLGVPVEEAYLYSVDRVGFSLLGIHVSASEPT